MPEQVQCPSCKQKLRVPDNLLGKKVKCPKSHTIFDAKVDESKDEEEGGSYAFTPEPEPKPRSKALRRASGEDVEDEEEDEDEDAPVRKKRRSDDEDSEAEEEEEDEEESEEQRRIKKKKAKRVKRSRAADKVWWPALFMQITAVIAILWFSFNVIFYVLGLRQAQRIQQMDGPTFAGFIGGFVCAVSFLLIIQIAILLGASRLKRLESYREALFLSILCFLPCTFCFMGLPIGIWTLVLINSADVRPFFKG